MLARFRRWLARKLDPQQYAENAVTVRYVDTPVVRLTRTVLDDYKRKLNVNTFVSNTTTELQVAWMAGVNYAITVLEQHYGSRN